MNQQLAKASNPMAPIKAVIEAHKAKVEEAMPQYLRGQLPRFLSVALLTIQRSRKVVECEPVSLLAAVIDGARLGLMCDGKLGHIVVYNNKKKLANGKEEWVKEAQFQADYKGLIAIARRTKVISDCHADVIREADVFNHGIKDGNQYLEHTYNLFEPRGNIIGAYCRLTFPDGRWAYRVIGIDHIEKARAASKSPNDGPWVTWYEEMAKKTVLRSAIKLYSDDPDIAMALEMDDRHFAEPQALERQIAAQPVATLQDVTQMMQRRLPQRAAEAIDFTPRAEQAESTQVESAPQQDHSTREEITPFEAAQIAEQEAERKPKAKPKQGALIDTSDPYRGAGQ